jgi:AcrR family transcriptional regulator
MVSTKDKILDSVISYIEEESSLEYISVSQIAQRAGFGKSTVYDYFDNKEALIEEAYIYLLDKYQKILLSDIPLNHYQESMKALLRNILDVIKNAKLIMDAIFNSDKGAGLFHFNQCSDKIKTIQIKMEEKFRVIAEMGIKEGVTTVQDNPYIGHVIQAIISGLMFQYVHQKLVIEEEDLIQLIYQEITRIMKS